MSVSLCIVFFSNISVQIRITGRVQKLVYNFVNIVRLFAFGLGLGLCPPSGLQVGYPSYCHGCYSSLEKIHTYNKHFQKHL